MERQIQCFADTGKLPLQLFTGTKCSAVVFQQEKAYWAKLYRLFTDYLYSKGCFDNYVATQLKILRTFLRYLQKEKGWIICSFLPQFRVSKETIPVVVLSPVQLHFLIHDAAFEKGLSLAQKRIKDILVAGCTVALRISDLMNLSRYNLVMEGSSYYLAVVSGKTKTRTSLLLPGYAAGIFLKYSKQSKFLLPRLSIAAINKQIRGLAELAGWTAAVGKVRLQRGAAKQQLTTQAKPAQYRFCDLLSSHAMRRTAITTMLVLGTPEQVVRQISGHAPGSKEFFRYVAYSRSYLDQSVQLYHNKMQDKDWKGV